MYSILNVNDNNITGGGAVYSKVKALTIIALLRATNPGVTFRIVYLMIEGE